MMSPQRFLKLWGSEDLMHYDRSRVQALTIPAVSKRFLIQAGLPRIIDDLNITVMQLQFPELPLLGEKWGSQYTFPTECFSYRVLSVIVFRDSVVMKNRIASFFCIDEQAEGRVMELHSSISMEMKADFLNSSIPQFAEFCLVERQYDRWVTQRYQEREQFDRPFLFSEAEAMAEEVRRTLRQVDPKAFLVPDGEDYSHWESVLLEYEMSIAWSP